MEKITITLKQHTPLLHFQPTQDGATLRASEVKPRLDKFILTELGKKEKDAGRYVNESDYYAGCIAAKKKGWLIGTSDKDKLTDNVPAKEKRALNYKMRITPQGDPDPINVSMSVSDSPVWNEDRKKQVYKTTGNSFPLVLSNMAGKEKKEDLANFSFYSQIEITLTFFSGNLVNEIGNISFMLEKFFYNNNFGQRANKGFGSFTVYSINGKNCKFSIDNKVFFAGNRYLEFSADSSLKIFQVIDYFWKRLKSGTNYGCKTNDAKRCNNRGILKKETELDNSNKRGYNFVHKLNKEKRYCKEDNYYKCEKRHYKRSLLYQYVNKYKDCNWEKRAIKEKFDLGNKFPPECEGKNPVFARAALGLPSDYKYTSPRRETVNIKEDVNVERIESPFYFKPITSGNSVFVLILIKDSHILKKENDEVSLVDSLLHKSFEFVVNGNTETLSLGFPQIDYKDFLSKACFKFKPSGHKFTPKLFNGYNVLDNDVKINKVKE